MEYQKNNNTGLIVTVTILSMLVLGLTGFVIYDKLTEKQSNNNIEENEISNNQQKEETKVVELDIEDLTPQLSELINEVPNIFDIYGDSSYSEDPIDHSMFIAVRTISNLYVDVSEVYGHEAKDKFYNGDYNYNVYVEAKYLKEAYKRLFGPDAEFTHHTFNENGWCNLPGIYDSSKELYWGGNGCGFDVIDYSMPELKKIEQKGDVIITYWLRTNTLDSNLNVELEVKFKKQSDGNYYFNQELL